MTDTPTLTYIPFKAEEDAAAAIERIRKELDTEPPKEAVKSKDGFDYLHGYYVFARANQIFGPMNVSYVERGSRVLFRGTRKTKNGEKLYVVCDATAGVYIALPGGRIYYTEGTATCDATGSAYGDAFDMARKGAYTDARKVAFRPLGKTFGAHFSLDDWTIRRLEQDDDAEEPRERKSPPPPTKAPTQKKAPAKTDPPEADAPKEPPAQQDAPAANAPPDPVKEWWAEIKIVGEELHWDRKTIARYVKAKYPDREATDLGPDELGKIHLGMVHCAQGKESFA